MVSKETRLVNRQVKLNKRHPGTSLADQKRLAERRKNAMSMRIAGATLQDIVNAGIGYNNTSMVSQDLKKALSNFYQEDIESLLILDLARIDEMQKICTFVMRSQQDTSQVRNLMALMQFRRETMGYKPEDIADRRATGSSVTNNGIMVVQGSTRDYLQGLMEAVGASDGEIEREFREVDAEVRKSAGHQSLPEVPSQEHTRTPANSQARIVPQVIQGEVITPEKDIETGTGSSKKKKFKRVSKQGKPASSDQPGSSRPPEAPVSASQPHPVSQVALGDSILLGELVEARARQLEDQIEHMHEPGLGDLNAPAVIPQELAIEGILEVPVKLPDANVPVSPGVVYRNPPRKLTEEEGQKHVTRRLKRPTQVDRLRTHVLEEEI